MQAREVQLRRSFAILTIDCHILEAQMVAPIVEEEAGFALSKRCHWIQLILFETAFSCFQVTQQRLILRFFAHDIGKVDVYVVVEGAAAIFLR